MRVFQVCGFTWRLMQVLPWCLAERMKQYEAAAYTAGTTSCGHELLQSSSCLCSELSNEHISPNILMSWKMLCYLVSKTYCCSRCCFSFQEATLVPQEWSCSTRHRGRRRWCRWSLLLVKTSAVTRSCQQPGWQLCIRQQNFSMSLGTSENCSCGLLRAPTDTSLHRPASHFVLIWQLEIFAVLDSLIPAWFIM